MALLQAYNCIHRLRSIMPDPHFMKELMLFEQSTIGTNSFEFMIDEYNIDYIMSRLGIDRSSYKTIKTLYNNNNKDCKVTEKLLI